MLNVFSKNRCGPISLDVGADGVKMLQLTMSGGKISVVAAGRRHPPEPVGETGDPQARQRFAVQAARELLKSGGFRGRDVISCLRTDELVIKNIRLPHMPEAELASAIQWECRERFEFEVAPDRVHFINAGEVRQGSEVRNEIILMAVPEEKVQSHLEMLGEMRLRPLHIDAEPLALFRAYQRFLRRAADESAVSVIVDIGLAGTRVVVARGATPIFIKNIDVNGHRFNQSVAKELGLSYAEACHVRRRLAGPRDGEALPAGDASKQVEWSVIDAIRHEAESLAREISLCLRYCLVTFRGLRPAKITLTGGEAYDRALVKLLDEHLDFECVVGQPLRGVGLGSTDLGADRRGMLTEWSAATGLALRALADEARARKAGDGTSRLSA